MQTKRIESLDYLRGLMALSIMLYHYISWSFDTLGAEYLLGKLGVYAVSVFYILSGVSLSIVYCRKIDSLTEATIFFIKRVFRILPLFWIVTSGYVLLKFLSVIFLDGGEFYSYRKIFLNYTMLFSFLDPKAYIATGGWSLGNEIVFYTVLPVLFLFSYRIKLFLEMIFILSCALGGYFAFFELSQDHSLSDQWELYINPFNQMFLFLSGVMIGKYKDDIKKIITNEQYAFLAVIFLFFAFWLYPAHGDKIITVSGINRLVFSVLCILFVALTLLVKINLPFNLRKTFLFLGESCYSIYLLHPLMALPIVYVFRYLNVEIMFAYLLAIPVTLIHHG